MKGYSEFIVYGRKGKYSPQTNQYLPGIFSYSVNHNTKSHISSKPLLLLKDLMQIIPEGGTVLDPFVGGGTTAQAARETGRECIATERSHEYAERVVSLLKTN